MYPLRDTFTNDQGPYVIYDQGLIMFDNNQMKYFLVCYM